MYAEGLIPWALINFVETAILKTAARTIAAATKDETTKRTNNVRNIDSKDNDEDEDEDEDDVAIMSDCFFLLSREEETRRALGKVLDEADMYLYSDRENVIDRVVGRSSGRMIE
jgi:hypothetical protein